MPTMILKMSAVTTLYVLLTAMIWLRLRGRKPSLPIRILIGIIYGVCSILSTHFGVDYSHMLLNVRDLGPLSAGLFFDPLSGIIAGLIGGVERYIAGTFWGVGSYTRIACSVSTCLAGFVAALISIFIFKRKKPSAIYAFFMGAVMEVFHMYVVFITHRNDMKMAFYVVKTCSPPMIIFSGLGLAASAVLIKILAGEWKNPLIRLPSEKISVTVRFQRVLFAVVFVILVLNLLFTNAVDTQTSFQDAQRLLLVTSGDIRMTYDVLKKASAGSGEEVDFSYFHVGNTGTYDILQDDGLILAGNHPGTVLTDEEKKLLQKEAGQIFKASLFGEEALCLAERLDEGLVLLTRLPMSEVYSERDAQAYESAFSVIILFAVIFVAISILVQEIVVNKIARVNESLDHITRGNLDEVVNVRDSLEFANLSDDINGTVTALKGYIDAEKKRMEKELEMARSIQDSALPKNFKFPRRDFEIYATMDPAKEVGGDFYDFFFVDQNRIALVIADVSGKGIPAALFMMRAKTTIRNLAESGLRAAEILGHANDTLCEGNDADMFVTVWLGIVDLLDGRIECANAGHEYPILLSGGGDFELYKDRHGPPLATMQGLRYRAYELQMHAGDRLFVYTDGIPEAIDKETNDYGSRRLLKILNENKNGEMEDLLPVVREDIQSFVGEAEQFDDITMLGFTYFGKGEGDEGTIL